VAAENFKVKKGLEVGTAITATSSGVNVTGIVTATQFVGDGSGLTGVTGSGSGVVVKDEGSAVGTAGTINFVGSGVAASLSLGTATVTINSGGLSDVAADTTPQLGGNLDLNGKFVNGTGGANITGVVTATTLKGNGDFVDIDVDGRADLDDVVVAGVSTFNDDIKIIDNKKIFFGTGGDLEISHNPSSIIGEIQNHSGPLLIQNSTQTAGIFIRAVEGQNSISIDPNAAVRLHYNNVERIKTSSSGAIVTGILTATTFKGGSLEATSASFSSNIDANGNLDVDGQTDLDDLVVSGVGTFSTRIDTNGVSLGTNNNNFAAKFIDGAVANFGTDNDLFIRHTGNDATIKNNTGNLYLVGGGSGTILQSNLINLKNFNNNETYATFTQNGAVDLYYDNAKKFETSSSGATVTGTLTATAFSGDGSALTGVTASGSGIIVRHDGSVVGTASSINFSTNLDVSAISAGIVTVTASGGGGGGLSNIVEDTTPQLGGDLDVNGKKIKFPDLTGSVNNILYFGTGDDLLIYHLNDINYIQCENSRTLRIQQWTGSGNETLANFIPNGAVELYHNNAKKIETYSGGVQITGNVYIPDGSNSGNYVGLGNAADLRIYHDGSLNVIDATGHNLEIRHSSEKMIVAVPDGAVELYHDNVKKFETTVHGGTLTGSLTITNDLVLQDDLRMGDTDEIQMGDSLDFRLYHTSGTNYIEAWNNSNFKIAKWTGSAYENMAQFFSDGAVELYFDANKKFETTQTGAVITGIATATTFSGSGASLTALNASNLGSGTIPNGRFPATLPAVSGANLTALNASEITSGTLPIARIADDAVTFAKMQNVGTGVIIGRNDGGSGDLETLSAAEVRTLLNVADGATAGITTSPDNVVGTWSVTANGSSAYRFTGPGQSGNEDDPDIYLVRGQRYSFINTTGSSHPFRFRVSSGGSTYSDGVSGSENGTQYFNVQHDAPASLVYQCTIHGGMVGNIYIVGQHLANGANNRVLTATSAYGLNGEANLTFDGSTLAVTGEITPSNHINLASGKKLSMASDVFKIYHSTNAAIINESGDLLINQNVSNKRIKISTGSGPTESVRITQDGRMKVGYINNVDPTTVFDVMASAVNQDIVRFTGANYNRGLKISTAASGAVNDALIKYDADSQNSAGQHAFLTDGTERLRIDSSGNVGINDTDPSYALNVIGDNTASNGIGMLKGIIGVQNDTTAYGSSPTAGISFQTKYRTGPDVPLDVAAIFGGKENTTNGDKDGYMGFATREEGGSGNQERMRITSGGELLINKTSSDSSTHLLQLYAEGTASCNGRITTGGLGNNADLAWSAGASNRDTAFGVFKNASNNPGGYMRLDTEDDTTTYAWFDNNRVFRVSGNYQDIGTTGGTVVGTQGSDIRLKDLVGDGSVSYGLSEINQITPIKFKYKKDPRTASDISNGDVIKTRIGFSAQQVKSIIPEAVYDTDEQVEGEDNIMAMEYVSLIPVLTNAVKELSTEIDKLKAEIAALKSS